MRSIERFARQSWACLKRPILAVVLWPDSLWFWVGMAMLAIAFAALAVVPTEMSTRDPQVPSGGGALIEEPPSTDTPAFSQAHMRFCRFQQVRLEGVGPLTDAADLAVFQALAQDWNTRCAGRSYEHPERRTVDAEAIERRELLESEGRSLLRAWRRKIRVAMKTPANSIPPASDSALASMPALPSIITFGVTGKVETEAISWPMPSNPGLALLHQSVAARVQRRLTELGYIISPVDGIWGAASRMALRHFKEANGLLSDDVLDGETVARLFSTSAVLSAAAAPAGTRAANAFATAYSPPDGGRMNPLNAEDADQIQRRLAELGYYVGNDNGIWGSASREALRAFKNANGLVNVDEWDAATEKALVAAPPLQAQERGLAHGPKPRSALLDVKSELPGTRSAVSAAPRRGSKAAPPTRAGMSLAQDRPRPPAPIPHPNLLARNP